MNGLRLIADDLTGALDSGCAFAKPEATVVIAVPGRALPKSARIAISTESRDMSETDAAAAVSRAVRDLSVADPETLWFKKIDSVMRGHPFAETVAALEAGEFAHCIFAPAYPGMGRITLKMQQYLTNRTPPPQPVGPDFRDAFQSLKHGWRVAPPDGRTPDSKATGVITIIEADSQPLLRQRVQSALSAAAGKMLWVGTGGLAAALTPERAPARFPPVRGVIVGTNHDSTRQQIAAALSEAVFTELTDTMPIGRATGVLMTRHRP